MKPIWIYAFRLVSCIISLPYTIEKVYKSLKPGGKFLIWVYGHEGNELYS